MALTLELRRGESEASLHVRTLAALTHQSMEILALARYRAPRKQATPPPSKHNLRLGIEDPYVPHKTVPLSVPLTLGVHRSQLCAAGLSCPYQGLALRPRRGLYGIIWIISQLFSGMSIGLLQSEGPL